MAVYGLTGRHRISESNLLDPYSFYGISKQAGEQYVRHYQRQGMDATIFRMFNVYGPGQNLANLKQGMVSIYLAFLAMGQPILVRGSMKRFRDFIYIDDVVDAWLCALDDPRSYGRVYNLGTGKKTTVGKLIEGLMWAWGFDPETYSVEVGDGTLADQFGIYADITRLTTDLGWLPRTPLAKGLQRTVNWAKKLNVVGD